MRILVTLVACLMLAGCMGTPDPTPTPSPTPTPPPASPTPSMPTPASPTPEPTPEPTPTSPTPATPATPTSPTANTTTQPPPVSINIQNVVLGFEPATKSVPVGTNVTWTNKDAVAPHTATANDNSFDSKTLSPGGAFSFVFTTAGSFPYKCTIHPTMTGTITVT